MGIECFDGRFAEEVGGLMTRLLWCKGLILYRLWFLF